LRRYWHREPQHMYEYSVGYRPPSVLMWLIAINVAVFVLLLGSAMLPGRAGYAVARFVDGLVLHPRKALLGGFIWQLVTYSFVHAGPLHLVLNMLMLYWFGREMEAFLGRRSFLGLYLVGAFVAGLAHSLAYVRSPIPPGAVGASGAVFAILVLFACHFPNRYVYFMLLLPMKVKYLVLIFIAINLIYTGQGTGIATLAHLGGAAYGYLYYRYRYAIESVPSAMMGKLGSLAGSSHERDWRRLRKLSEKASLGGLDSLTPRERRLLMRLSNKLRGSHE
jgi:membrane associated rhomboid family serine protease